MEAIEIILKIAAFVGFGASIGYFFDKYSIYRNNHVLSDKVAKVRFSGLRLFSKLSWRTAFRDSRAITQELIKQDEYIPSIIVGIGRGGAIFGSLLSYDLFETPLLAIDRSYEWGERRKENLPYSIQIPNSKMLRRVLLVAGEAHTGDTMMFFKEFLKQHGAQEIRTCVFYKQENCKERIDYNITEGRDYRILPWHRKGHLSTSHSEKVKNKQDELRKKYFKKKPIVIYLVRHAETIQNADGDRITGVTAAQLSEKGKKQAEFTANYLADLGPFDVIFTSDYDRSWDTAKIIASRVNCRRVLTDANLREMHYGIWENMRREDVKLAYPNDYVKYEENPALHFPEGAEDPKNVKKRIDNFFLMIDNEFINNVNKIIIVTHKTTGRILLCDFLNMEISKFRQINLNNCSISKINYNADSNTVEHPNYTGHLSAIDSL